MYVELETSSNFSFLSGASHPEELCDHAFKLGYRKIGLTDRHTLAGVVRAHVAAKKAGVQLLVGTRIRLRAFSDDILLPQELPLTLLLYPHCRAGYARLSSLLTRGKLRAPKAECFLGMQDILDFSEDLECLVDITDWRDPCVVPSLQTLRHAFGNRLSLIFHRLFLPGEGRKQRRLLELSKTLGIPLVATNGVTYHSPKRRALQDVLCCIREGCRIDQAGYRLQENAERFLKSPKEMARLFRKWPRAIRRSEEIAERASGFSLDELKYEYPNEICPNGKTPEEYLREQVYLHVETRFPEGLPPSVHTQIEHELKLIRELQYEKYFLTVHDIVKFARGRGILCQGRGAAANSAVCYVLGITAVDPTQVRLLMERFISKERNEPPDIDIDFEHERREEVIQYIYEKYGRHRAAIVAEVICYRTRSAFRDIGKVFGLSEEETERIIKVFTRFRDREVTEEHMAEIGVDLKRKAVRATLALSRILRGFPRHLSQHVGGFVISDIPLSEIVPIENAAMENRTVLEWDKDDIDAMGMLKIDVLALGMLTAIRKGLDLINLLPSRSFLNGTTEHQSTRAKNVRERLELHTIPREDPAVYDMVCLADTLGVFQIESRAQMSMLPRLRPRCYYDLVIEVAIVRPGPIQGGMVHPFLRRRMGREAVTFPDERIRSVLEPTMGVPIFQEQVMELSVVAAGFSPGEADELRRAMASWKRNKNLIAKFRDRIFRGMLARGYSEDFAERLFDQIKGFGEYGFPQSHSASFAQLVYASAWIKRHYPACFAAALINSQPMGFYQPAQIIQDAKNHGVEVLPVDVNHSDWDCFIDSTINDKEGRLRLGMRMIRGLNETEIQRLVSVRRLSGSYRTILDLWRRSKVKVSQLRMLARADAFRSMGYDRQRALWEIGKLKDERLPLFDGLEEQPEETSVFLPQIKERMQVWRDYSATGLSLRKHPLAFARKSLQERQVITIAEFKERSRSRPNSWVTIAGLVLMRQRPSTAKGTIFMTVEDETGMGNIIIRRGVQEKYQDAIMDGMFVIVRGRTQEEVGVVHLLLEEIWAFSQGTGEIEASSRDFR